MSRAMIKRMKAPGDHRPTWRNGIIQIQVTRACDLACVSCTQGSNLAGKPVIMTPENFRLACESLKDYFGVVGIFGGNPCIHPKFPELCEILSEIIPYEQRGLWSNNLNGYGELCRKTFNPAVSNLNVHLHVGAYNEMKRDWPECNPMGLTQDSRHSPPYVAISDLDISNAEAELLISNCDINQLWSAMVCQFRGELRGFFCEIAGAQSMLHEEEKDYPDTGLRVFPGWWRLPIENFEDQIYKHCFECGVPLKGLGDLAVTGNNEYVSETHKKIYKLKRPTGKTLHLVTKREELGGKLNRSTDYIQNGKPMTDNAKIMICVPTKGFTTNDAFYEFYLNVKKPDNTLLIFSRGQSPARNRNLMILSAIEQNCTHILFLDDDTAPPSDIIDRLLAHDKDIVTGLYFMRNYPHQPIIFYEAYDDGRCAWRALQKGETGLIEIVNTGLGACLIKVDVFRRMLAEGFTKGESTTREGQKIPIWITIGEALADDWTDDVAFFNRARKMGYKLYCDLDVRSGHFAQLKILPLIGEDGTWHIGYDTGGTDVVRFPHPIQVVKEEDKQELVKQYAAV